jgi:hypothetical protein
MLSRTFGKAETLHLGRRFDLSAIIPLSGAGEFQISPCGKTYGLTVLCSGVFFISQWTKGIPLEVSTFGATPLLKYHLPKLGVVHAQLRPGEPNKAGPCVTDNGNLIIDAHFGPISNPAELEAKLKVLPGVIETGLFVAKCSKAYLGMEDGYVVNATSHLDA